MSDRQTLTTVHQINRMKKYILVLIIFLASALDVCCQAINNKKSGHLLPDTMFLLRDTSELNSLFKMFNDSSVYYRKNTYSEAWYTGYLYVLKEPVLFTDTTPKEVYRFTWVRTFDNPVSVRIEKNKNSYELYWKQSDGKGGYYPGKLITEKHKKIDKNEWDAFVKMIDQTDFWNLKTDNNYTGIDGATWILEGKKLTRYHKAEIWSPGSSGKFYQCCDYLLGLTDLKIKNSEKY